MTDKNLTPGESLWILNNLPQTPPPFDTLRTRHGVMPTAWLNHRRKITLKLQRIIDTASREVDYRKIERTSL